MEETRDWTQEQSTEGMQSEAPQQMPAQPQEQAPPEEPEATGDTPLPPVEAVWESLGRELTALNEQGWSIEQLRALSQDEEVRAAMAAGAALREAAKAYADRTQQGKEVMRIDQADAPEGRNARKRGVPALRTAAAGAAAPGNAIDRMSGEEFARFSDSMYQRLMAGEKIAL